MPIRVKKIIAIKYDNLTVMEIRYYPTNKQDETEKFRGKFHPECFTSN